MQVLYLGRAPRTKETLPDFREKCRVTRHSRVFHSLTGSQRTPGFCGVTERAWREMLYLLSKFLGDRTDSFKRSKRENSSPQQELLIKTEIREF